MASKNLVAPTFEELQEVYLEIRNELLDKIAAVRKAARTFTDALEGRRVLDFTSRFVTEEEKLNRERLEYQTWRELSEAEMALAIKISKLRYERNKDG